MQEMCLNEKLGTDSIQVFTCHSEVSRFCTIVAAVADAT